MDPFQNVPNEILVEIFCLCLPTEAKYQIPDPLQAPLLLTHVCSTWRNVATRNSALWQSLALLQNNASLTPHEAVDAMESLARQFMLWSTNSRQLPLDVKIFLHCPHCPGLPGMEHPFLVFYWSTFWQPIFESLLERHSNRIRKLYLSIDSLEQGISVYKIPNYPMPLLESLQLSMDYFDDDTSVKISNFSQSPRLRKVILDVWFTPTTIDLPWSRLTHLIITRSFPWELFYFIVHECPILETLSLVFREDETRPTEPLTLFFLRELKLELTSSSESPVPNFFIFLDLPVLQDLELSMDVDSTGEAFEWLPMSLDYYHFRNQIHNLRKLHLGYHDISSTMLLDLLRFTPLLEDFAVDAILVSYIAFLEGITWHPHSEREPLIPRLEIFHLYVEINHINRDDAVPDPTFPFTHSNFLSMVSSRTRSALSTPDRSTENRPVSPLKELFLCVELVEEPHALDLHALQQEFNTRDEFRGIQFSSRVSNSKNTWHARGPVETW